MRHARLVFTLLFLVVMASACRAREVRFTSEPPGAEVRLDEQVLGVTPVQRQVVWPEGQDVLSVIFRLDGYEDLKQSLAREGDWDDVMDIHAVLRPLPGRGKGPADGAPMGKVGFCPECGQKMEADARFCPACGRAR
jgi:hypothetical protein